MRHPARRRAEPSSLRERLRQRLHAERDGLFRFERRPSQRGGERDQDSCILGRDLFSLLGLDLDVIAQRIAEKGGLPASMPIDDVVDILFTLTSFETFDALARGRRRPEDVATLVQRLALATLGKTG